MYGKIGDYAIIGNLHSIALIGSDGSIDWLCLPHLDSPSVFGALLDDKKGGRFSITPVEDRDSMSRYEPDTNVLTTVFRTRTGIAKITDFMPVPLGGEEEPEDVEHLLYRRIEGLEKMVDIRIVFEPRFDYARAETTLERNGQGVSASGGGRRIVLSSTRPLTVHDGRCEGRWNLAKGDTVWLLLRYGPKPDPGVDEQKAESALRETEEYWRTWLKKSETGRSYDLGPYENMVKRSALALKLLFHDPTGAIAAAATTSLPEEIGGVRNWDYRFTWIRDASFTLQALFHLGHLSEMEGYLRWIESVISRHGAEKLQIMYGLRGEEDLAEEELSHLDGYKGSKPVRIGNGAAKQKQLDIYGELMDAAQRLSDYVGKISPELWPSLRGICDHVVAHWREKDFGIWEIRGGPHHFVYSKVMCWVALDRGITIARRYGFPGELETWDDTRKEIKEEVLRRGWNEEKRAFVQHYETDALDSSNLLIPLAGFLPFDDPRVVSTAEAIRRELSHDGFLYRYTGEDGLPGREGTFLLCTFWMISHMIAQGMVEEAERLLLRVEAVANPVGLFAEEYDFEWNEPLGNFPQAFTHIGYITSVIALCRAKGKSVEVDRRVPPRVLLSDRIVLNAGVPPGETDPKEIVPALKNVMNVLRGAFFDTRLGRVAYEEMRRSKAYGEYVRLSRSLQRMDLALLKSREEKLAFWINLYNVIVIHGVIEMGIRDSVKEVRNFFRRLRYRIGEMDFSPDDMEHGILRGNRRPPNSLFPLFRGRDRRLGFTMETVDPRIHFSLVCASSSCPPIDIYRAENLDNALENAGRTFLNSGGIKIDREKKSVSLSRIFKWYAADFGATTAERLKFIAPLLYDEKDREFLEMNQDGMKIDIDYQEYDWRLNRT